MVVIAATQVTIRTARAIVELSSLAPGINVNLSLHRDWGRWLLWRCRIRLLEVGDALTQFPRCLETESVISVDILARSPSLPPLTNPAENPEVDAAHNAAA